MLGLGSALAGLTEARLWRVLRASWRPRRRPQVPPYRQPPTPTPRGVPRSPPGWRHAEPLLGRAQLSVRRRVRGPGGRRRQAGLRRAGEYWLVCLRHYCHGKHQFSDVDLLQPGPQFLYVFSHCVCHSDVFEHTQLGHLRLRAVRRVPGGLVVGRSVPHPLWAHPDPQDTPTHLGGKQAAVIDPL